MAVRRRSGKDRLRDSLRKIGLQALTDWWWEHRQAGWSNAEIMLAVRDTRTYKNRFAGLDKARAAGLPIDEAGYIQFEQAVFTLARNYEIPKGFMQKYIAGWIAGGKSAVELQDILEQNLAVIDAHVASNPQVQAELANAESMYGIKPTRGDLLAMVFDPKLGQREAVRRLRAVRAGATAQTTGYGTLSRAEAEELGGYETTAEEEQEGFGQLYEAQELFRPLDAGEDTIGRREQFGATFGGNAAARRRIAERQRRRQASFEGGGGFAADREGFSGLGSAST